MMMTTTTTMLTLAVQQFQCVPVLLLAVVGKLGCRTTASPRLVINSFILHPHFWEKKQKRPYGCTEKRFRSDVTHDGDRSSNNPPCPLPTKGQQSGQRHAPLCLFNKPWDHLDYLIRTNESCDASVLLPFLGCCLSRIVAFLSFVVVLLCLFISPPCMTEWRKTDPCCGLIKRRCCET